MMVVRGARPDDLTAVEQVLRDSGLPTSGVKEWLPQFLVAEDAGRVVAVAGLEQYGTSALLRSVAVTSERRGTGLGRVLVERLLMEAARRGTRDVYLLTTTAEDYFPRLGFASIAREETPEPVRASVEFTEACPASAIAMRKTLASQD
jgi:amino-acid N-acetyltransferase